LTLHTVCAAIERETKRKEENILSFFQNVLRILDTQITQPKPYGWFHILWLVASILAGVVLCITHKKGDDARVRKVVLITAITVVIWEIYKQINYSFSYENGIEFNYQWYIFPWQFCSTPMYIGLLAGLTKKSYVHRAASAYLATFAFFAGAAVMVYPNDVFTGTLGVCIQTMICHGSMITIAIYLLGSGYVKANWKSLLQAMSVFAVTVGIAVILNEVAHATGITKEHFFNMFYISPHCDPHLPVYSDVQRAVPYPLDLIIYIAGFSAASGVILLSASGIQVLAKKLRKKATV
jgi:hypothetical protein